MIDINKVVRLLKQIIEIPSYSRNEGLVADLLEKQMMNFGCLTNRVGNNLWTCDNIDKNKPTLLLNAHLDTVKPVSGWKYKFDKATEINGRIYGLGSNDDGGSLVSLLFTYMELKAKEQSYNLIFAASAEEEISGKNGIESLLKEMPKIDLGLVGEPTGMKMAIAERGLMVLDCKSRGKAGHAARNEGVNAIYKAITNINKIKNYKFEKESQELGMVKMSVTMINAGIQHNIIPDECSFVVDVRTNDCYSNLEVLDKIKNLVDCEVKERSTRLNSSYIDKSHPLVLSGLKLGLKTFGSPTLSDQSLMSFPTLKIGPGDSSRSHTANEYIEIIEIENALNIYFNMLDGLKF